MTAYSVADAKNKFSELIDRAQKGEDILITRHGQPAAKIQGIPAPGRRMTPADVEWLKANRVKRRLGNVDAGSFVSRMRDEDER